MQRTGISFLQNWLHSSKRLPLIIRGARQVGKTWLVREFAASQNKRLIEVNLEDIPEVLPAFSSNDPQVILQKLSSAFETTIDPSESLLFIDEIQEAPEVFSKLRWFAEKMPELPVIAAGSLLEFVLGKAQISMPVGRINYMYLEPLSFEEFLLAHGRDNLVAQMKEFTFKSGILELTHQKLISLFKEYLIVGGMPAAVDIWSSSRSFEALSQKHRDILRSYRDDFGKYGGRIPSARFNEIVDTVPKDLGRKFVYSSVSRKVSIPIIKETLALLCQARVCHKVSGVAANGIPLAAEPLNHYLKVILLDVGLSSAELGLSLSELDTMEELDLINKGGIAEQAVGQLLRTTFPFYQEPALYYWVSTDKGASAEIDYVIQHGSKVMPVEVKAGSSGSLKSLHHFMHLKKLSRAVRINSGLPLLSDINVQDTQGNPVKYKLLSIPLYLTGELHRLLQETA